ncbi:MAG: LysR family transcriptional regulator [Gammaproteobacteria bacterium]|nr:LysR family transcriptional regulator [Gammaproteobacteria bacterium]MDH5777278.1 LysR family transcriptional regulator [Gammaproteobacteria bacterium]
MNTTTDMDWDDLRIVLAICREGSLAGAARVLGTSHSTVFRQINNIEERFASRFFTRTPQGYAMTEAGELVMRMASNIEEEMIELQRELQGKNLQLQGNVRLTTPEGVSNYLLMPHLASFYSKHPDINVELLPSSVIFQIARGEADLAIRVADSPPQNCIAKEICEFRMGLYVHDAYLQTSGVKEVWEYDYLLCHFYLPSLAKHVWKNKPTPRIKFSTDSVTALAKAAKEGLGVAALPCLIGEQEPTLTRIDSPGIEFFKSKLWILTHGDLRQTARIRALMSHLYDGLSADRHLIEGC